MVNALSYPGLIPRQSNPQDDRGPAIDSPGEKAAAAVAIIVGVLLIVLASYFCCCRKSLYKKNSELDQSKDLERAAQQPPQAYEMQSQPLPQYYSHSQPSAPAQLPDNEAEIQADGRVPADQVFPSKEVHDPPPEYPGSPAPRPAELR